VTEPPHSAGPLGPDGMAALGEAILRAGTPDGSQAIAAFIGMAVPNDVTVVFAWQRGRRPRHVHENYDAPRKRQATEVYLKGAYLLDPFYVAGEALVSDCVLRLRDVQTDKFRQSEYYRSYYVGTGLIDEISFYAACPEGAVLAVSIGRYGGGSRFSRRDFGRARALLPVVAALIRRQWLGEVAHGAEGERTVAHEAVSPLLQLLAHPPFAVLTAREREIVALMLRGHSSKSMADAVAISVGTVKNHRKNIYRKLSVHSQSELFARFLDLIG